MLTGMLLKDDMPRANPEHWLSTKLRCCVRISEEQAGIKRSSCNAGAENWSLSWNCRETLSVGGGSIKSHLSLLAR